ncbi:UNVERIFIED_CONTAM: hypothetical protein Sradi_1545000, partial [Sesamum radiatum]
MFSFNCCNQLSQTNVEDYVDTFFKKEKYLAVYNHIINPVPGMHDFEESPLGKVAPSLVKSKVGRPKKIKMRDLNDIRETGRVSRKSLTHTCGICPKIGHNKRSCTNPPHPNSRKTKNPNSPTKGAGTSHTANIPPNATINLNE